MATETIHTTSLKGGGKERGGRENEGHVHPRQRGRDGRENIMGPKERRWETTAGAESRKTIKAGATSETVRATVERPTDNLPAHVPVPRVHMLKGPRKDRLYIRRQAAAGGSRKSKDRKAVAKN